METRLEPFRPPARRIAALGAGLALTVVVVVVAVSFLARSWGPSKEKDSTPIESPRSQIEFESGQLRKAHDAATTAKLSSWSWRDQTHREARVPIELAMKWVAERGTYDLPEVTR